MDLITKIVIAIVLSTWCLPTTVSSSPLYGGEKHHYDKSAVAPEFKPKQLQLSSGTAECVRTAWIGDVNNRTVICVEWRTVKKDGR